LINKDQILDILTFKELDIEIERASLEDRISKYEKDRQTYIELDRNSSINFGFRYSEDNIWPLIWEYDQRASSLGEFYFWFEDWCSRKIYHHKPEVHYDIGGRFDGFIGRLNTYGQKVVLFDVREMVVPLDNVEFIRTNAVEMKEIKDGTISSLSILGVLESMGLGRWGEPVDPNAWYKCLKSMERVMAKDGDLYISVPIGKEVLEFNARRVFMPNTIINVLSTMELKEFAVVDSCDENGKYLYEGYTKEWLETNYREDMFENKGQIFGCFWFKKK